MNVLVTGGAGFIGLTFSRYLKEKGYNVSIIDFQEQIDKKGIENEFTCYGYDLSETTWMDKVGTYDYIVHCAAQSGGYVSLIDPQKDCKWNCMGTTNVVDYAKKTEPKKILYTSSMAVYGNMNDATETSSPNPISFYGVSKLAGEYYIKVALEHSRVPYTIYRLFATYGSGQDLEDLNQGIVSIYYSLSLKDETIGIKGKKDRIRQLVHVADVCDAMYLALTNEKTDNETYNVVHEEICTPEKIIQTLAKTTGRPLKIKELDGYVGDQTNITGSNEKLSSLGWNAENDLKTGIKKFIDGIQ